VSRTRFLCVLVAIVSIASSPAHAYLKLGARVGGRTVTLKWSRMPIRYYLTDRSVSGVSASQLQAAVGRGFASWQAVGTATVSAELVGFTQASPFASDGMSTIGFVNRPDLDRVLGATTFFTDAITGEVLESDIFLNSVFAWSAADGGEANRFDVESIAAHEIGHLLGLAHSALGETEIRNGGRRVLGAEAIMFPVAFSAGTVEGRALKADDIAGISDIYPNSSFQNGTGSLSGRVTRNGRGIIGAHVIAFSLRSGALVAGFSLNDQGEFTLNGLEPGPHIVRVEPLDDGDIDSFFEATLNVDVDFRPKFYDRVVIVPRGGGTRGVNIAVVAK
jgi:matrixin